MSKFTVALTTAALLAFNVSAVSAQEAEIIALGDGSTITVDDYLLETSDILAIVSTINIPKPAPRKHR